VNGVRREADRWLTDNGDEVYVEPCATINPLPLDMFQSLPETPQPYDFRPEVDYQAGDHMVWKCDLHGDFNAPREGKWGPARCPQCNRPATEIIVMTR